MLVAAGIAGGGAGVRDQAEENSATSRKEGPVDGL